MPKKNNYNQSLDFITGSQGIIEEQEVAKEEQVAKEEKEAVKEEQAVKEEVKEITKVDFTENRTKSFSMVLRPSMLYLIKKYSNEHDISMSKVVERAICQYLDI